MEERRALRRTTIRSGRPWEELVGYARAVRVGPFVSVAGTTGTDAEGMVIGVGDAYAQAAQALRNVEAALAAVGATLGDVVRTRMYVTDITQWEQVARAHREVFGAIQPAATMVEVARLIDPAMLFEIEVDAIVADAPGDGA